MTQQELQALLDDLRRARVAVLGDFCLDVYWFVDPAAAEKSVETGLDTRPVASQRITLGGAGTIVNNLVAMGCGRVHALTVVGEDVWGREMLRLFDASQVERGGVLAQPQDWATMVYLKPYVHEEELNRFDFGNFNRLADATADGMLEHLRRILPEVDVVVVNEQVTGGLHTPALRRGLDELIRGAPEKIFLVDSRHFGNAYPGAYLKLNAHEAAGLCGIERAPDVVVPKDEVVQYARTLHARRRKPVFVTRGARGCLVCDGKGLTVIPGLQVRGPTDPVGAGDALLAGVALGLAAGREPAVAAELGNFAATVTVQKLRQTGTASPDEILAVGADPAYRPEPAEDPRRESPKE
jgi:rfaE bifunctional protein kinase chain/domain